MNFDTHQYIIRKTGSVQTETLCADPLIAWMYCNAREKAHWLFNALISREFSKVLAWLHYDVRHDLTRKQIARILQELGINSKEIADDVSCYRCLRDIFERKIRYADFRPMPDSPDAIVSPADARILIGSFSTTSAVFIKEKFFDYAELIGRDRHNWLSRFEHGDFAVFRLTPDQYHYNHVPVSGVVADHYEIPGRYHSCNPGAMVRTVTPLSKNRRIITVIDTDTDTGTRIGSVAMIEVVAMMIGDIVQCYSDIAYDDPRGVTKGMSLKKGQPKSLFRPGSSTTVLIFEKNRIRFSEDLMRNMFRRDISSRFSQGFGIPLVETDVRVRSEIGRRIF
ncbi:MAG: phosphatidylserine decarboxylase [Deltaproteobacteria bacterium]|nr:phosphatidylserine decarboxylase [Deltaproteobacteria bacterium]